MAGCQDTGEEMGEYRARSAEASVRAKRYMMGCLAQARQIVEARCAQLDAPVEANYGYLRGEIYNNERDWERTEQALVELAMLGTPQALAMLRRYEAPSSALMLKCVRTIAEKFCEIQMREFAEPDYKCEEQGGESCR